MPKPTHTPGPWLVERLDGDGHRALHITPSRGGRSVASIWPQTSTSRGVSEIQTEDEANALLVASAPDLLETLRYVELMLRGKVDFVMLEAARKMLSESLKKVENL